MPNVFISYARRDRDRVVQLASALEAEGLSVWWDPNLVPGRRFREMISEQLAAADSVVVVWTAASLESDWVQDEAEEARQRGVLVPVMLEPVKPPAGFRQLQAADLCQWTGSAQHPEFRALVQAAEALVAMARETAAPPPAAGDGGSPPQAVPAAPPVPTPEPVVHAPSPREQPAPPAAPTAHPVGLVWACAWVYDAVALRAVGAGLTVALLAGVILLHAPTFVSIITLVLPIAAWSVAGVGRRAGIGGGRKTVVVVAGVFGVAWAVITAHPQFLTLPVALDVVVRAAAYWCAAFTLVGLVVVISRGSARPKAPRTGLP